MELKSILLIIALAPLAGAIVAGLFGRQIGRAGAHWVTILGVGLSTALSFYVLKLMAFDGHPVFNENIYTWFEVGGISAHVGFLVDNLTAVMMVVVTFISLLVHIYTIGYMADDPGYQRFFAYISLFTFSMLMLVMSNNFLQLFFGWEAVGLVSYLLIGFWYSRPTAIFANLKAFIVNRVGDFGFLLGVAGVLFWLGTLDYATAFARADTLSGQTVEILPGMPWEVATFICVCLFIGAMGKSAQVPLHVWLPDSMEGPTPISALIHAATMVTAGIFMVARMSPLFEWSDAALSFVLVIGAITALFTGLIGLVQNDIKRVVAYSTLSQLGYMTVALGSSAYAAGIFHLMTHAFFKALLFLAAGSVIIGLHHQQNMQKMGGLGRYMRITFITCWVGSLALVGTPFFSGFYSKDAIIEAVHLSDRAGAGFAYVCVLLGVFVTALYSFRLLYLTFHGEERFRGHADAHDASGHGHHHHDVTPHESPWVVTLPLVLLAIPSIAIGYLTVGPMLFGGFFDGAIVVHEANDVLRRLGEDFTGPVGFALHGLVTPAFWLALGGFAVATFVYLLKPGLADRIAAVLKLPYRVLEKKYFFDELYQAVFARGSLKLGKGLWKGGDTAVIDGVFVDGSATLIDRIAGIVRWMQSGYLYHYAFAMIVGLIVLLAIFLRG
ncbi:MAG TPA: NADH-quinone oxidoreductase subunit L [Xanthomonadaceae bacterium]|nr:NADH-quinone oxidoreductase subunit L [Xanthomonadaceae bacterium]